VTISAIETAVMFVRLDWWPLRHRIVGLVGAFPGTMQDMAMKVSFSQCCRSLDVRIQGQLMVVGSQFNVSWREELFDEGASSTGGASGISSFNDVLKVRASRSLLRKQVEPSFGDNLCASLLSARLGRDTQRAQQHQEESGC